MRLATATQEGKTRLLADRRGDFADVSQAGRSLIEILQTGPDALARVQAAIGSAERFEPTQVAWLPPLAKPGKILAVGRNYAEHAKELGSDPPTEPLIFNKLITTLVGHEANIMLPPGSQQIDFEAELVAVIGRTGRHIAEHEALDHVAGYMCGNDVTARDWQKSKPGGQWLLGKSFDTFAPTGPVFVTADEVNDPQNLCIELRLNGETMQSSNTRYQIFPVAKLVSYVSQVCTLLPGDLIFTGTPGGVGAGRTPPVFLQDGDTVEVEIDGIGCLRNRVRSSAA